MNGHFSARGIVPKFLHLGMMLKHRYLFVVPVPTPGVALLPPLLLLARPRQAVRRDGLHHVARVQSLRVWHVGKLPARGPALEAVVGVDHDGRVGGRVLIRGHPVPRVQSFVLPVKVFDEDLKKCYILL